MGNEHRGFITRENAVTVLNKLYEMLVILASNGRSAAMPRRRWLLRQPLPQCRPQQSRQLLLPRWRPRLYRLEKEIFVPP